MKTLDRYIVRQFLTNYLLLLVSLLLLVITLDLIVNIDEFLDVAERMPDAGPLARTKAVLLAIADFYGPQVFLFFVYGAGILPIGAAGFTLASLTRNREVIAMLAGGVSLYRLALPILVVGSLLSTLTLVDHELVIPQLREKLIRDHHHMKHGAMRSFSIPFTPDPRNTVAGVPALVRAHRFDPNTNRMIGLTVLERDADRITRRRITADRAAWRSDPGGWALENGAYRLRLDRQDRLADASADPAPRPIAFIESGLDPRTLLLRRNARFKQLLSLSEIGELIERAGTGRVAEELRRIRHGRFSLVVLNVLILALGLPFFLVRAPIAALPQAMKAMCVAGGAWAGGYLMVQGGAPILPPAISAWGPALLCLPAALFLLDTVES